MSLPDPGFDITSLSALESLFDAPSKAAIVKESDRIIPGYRQLIEASPFVALATAGAGGLDCSPRGDAGAVAQVLDEKTLVLPDRRGNNRIDSLRNIIHDPRVALLFLIPGAVLTLRVAGRARISVDPALLSRFTQEGKPPKVVIVVSVESVFFQCSRSVAQAGLWDGASHVDASRLPTPEALLAQRGGAPGDAKYDPRPEPAGA
ncbi:hypothetical protein SAMN06265795_101280 [Noviherbaspirillum humi]|uniref:Pyridoxamine 5'-phosphate oxidase N-terminal domain-containing protein n=1 Tax=Noviherbaspirillum humi TaxID=1688639 RepID=A0A239C7G5_9BURK|nr:MSMEG_1061 family FMN-dependent PPOX-type flavoprotein [Noviherbaspirillum humi]SNS15608.1 hypothetical protein SAMN06265795_101280 [Noviherbaspirillum humi]